MAFGTATVITTVGKALVASQVNGTTATPPKYIGIGTGATGAARTAVVGDTALSTEVETRATGTNTIVTTTTANDTFQTVGTITATAGRAIDEAGLFTASTAGTMVVSATFPVVNLLTSDQLQITGKIIIA